MNTTTMEQPANHHNKDIHVEDQTDLSLIVRRLQAQVPKMQRHYAEEVVALQCEKPTGRDNLRLTRLKEEKLSQPQSAYPELPI